MKRKLLTALCASTLFSTAAQADDVGSIASAALGPVHATQDMVATYAAQPSAVIKVLFVQTANSDGTTPGSATSVALSNWLDGANQVFGNLNYPVKFVLDSRTDLTTHQNNSNLNNDCIPLQGQTLTSIEGLPVGDVDSDGKSGTNADAQLLCTTKLPSAARDEFALRYPDAVVVFVRGGRQYLSWDKKAGVWHVKQASGGHSGRASFHIAIGSSTATKAGPSTFLAHELGHYFHLAHTFGRHPSDLSSLYDQLHALQTDHPYADVTTYFDGDKKDPDHYAGTGPGYNGVTDTPADPGLKVFQSGADTTGCNGTGVLALGGDATTPGGNWVFTPDRSNVMSYFKGCPYTFSSFHFSKDQGDRVANSLQRGNRHPLIDPKVTTCAYDAGIGSAISFQAPEVGVLYRLQILIDCMISSSAATLGTSSAALTANSPGSVVPLRLTSTVQQKVLSLHTALTFADAISEEAPVVEAEDELLLDDGALR